MQVFKVVEDYLCRSTTSFRITAKGMPRTRHASGGYHQGAPNLGDLLTARPSGLTEQESWAVLCQAVQALQDLFLSDGASGGTCIPLVSPTTLMLSSRGRVRFYQNPISPAPQIGPPPPPHLAGYLAPEYRPGKHVTDTEAEKMWIYGLGETLKRATLTSHAATSRLSGELCAVLADMTRPQATSRASLMNLLDVISEYCKKRHQSRPFSHIVMDLHQEAMAALELTLDTPWGPPAMPELRPLTRNSTETTNVHSIPRRWMNLRSPTKQKLTREASTSMEDLSFVCPAPLALPGKTARPKSMCVPNHLQLDLQDAVNFSQSEFNLSNGQDLNTSIHPRVARYGRQCGDVKRTKTRRNPVQRAASRLYRAAVVHTSSARLQTTDVSIVRECVGPEFVVRAALPSKQFEMHDIKGNVRKTVTVILLNGQKVDVVCNPNTTTAGQLFELIIQKEHIEENFMLGLSALIAGDFVFLPSDTRICKAILPTSSSSTTSSTLTLFMRVRFFLPSLRGLRGSEARHLLYLQLRRSILEHQLPCSFAQLVELDGLALQAEFGDYNEREHGARDYFLLEHYVPETMSCVVEDAASLRKELIRSHKFKMGMDAEKAEEDFIVLAQNLPHYGGHFYTATWVLKDNTQKDVWLYISAQGINLYERAPRASQCGPMLYEMFEWKTIQTLCYSKHYLCVLPHSAKMHRSKLKKYKLKMDHKKSYFTFRLASLHHQFFLRLRTEFTSLNSLSMQFGIPLKDMKNETNSLYKLEALTNQYRTLDKAAVNAETEFKIEFRASSRSSEGCAGNGWRRSKSIGDFACDGNLEDYQNKENERPFHQNTNNGDRTRSGLVLDSGCLSGLPIVSDKRRGVKMGVRAFANNGQRVSRSMEAVNAVGGDDLEQLSLQSVSIHCSTASIPPSPNADSIKPEVYIVDTTLKSCDNQFLPNFQESLSETLLEKLNNISFAEERILRSVTIAKDSGGSLGMQITEGSDGKVYVQSVIPGGPAHGTGCIKSGDQIVAVDGKNLLSLKYDDALALLKMTGPEVEFIVSQLSASNASTLRVSELRARADLSDINESHLKSVRLERTMNKLKHISMQAESLEKHVTEDCFDVSNHHKYNREVPYHKHIRYEVEGERRPLNRTLSKSCADINDRAIVVDMIPKSGYQSLTRRIKENMHLPPPIALPRSLGLSRKWRGPVKYPVTPVKKVLEGVDNESTGISTSDEEQVFI